MYNENRINNPAIEVTSNTIMAEIMAEKIRRRKIRRLREQRRRRRRREKLLRIAILLMVVGVFVVAINMIVHIVNNKSVVKSVEPTIYLAPNIIELDYNANNLLKNSKYPLELQEETAEIEEEIVDEYNGFSEEFFQSLCCLTFAEGGIEDYTAQVSIASVILNRINSNEFPNTIQEVLNYPNAFASVKDEKIYVGGEEVKYEDIPERTKEAVRAALNGEDPTERLLSEEAIKQGLDTEKYAEGGAVYFYQEELCSAIALEARAYILVKVKIGTQYFYKYWDKA